MDFLTCANLPERAVGVVCLSGQITERLKKNIYKSGIDIIFTPDIEIGKLPISSHADILIHHLGENNFVCAPEVYEYFKNAFADTDINLKKGTAVLRDTYPDDCYYNAARIGKTVFFNVADNSILDFDKLNYTREINVNQGYAKCNICVVNENAVITSDASIYNAAIKNGFEVLKIRQGYIDIAGYDYGFIGGASGLISNDILGFCGDLDTHPDSEDIKSFLRNFNIYPECLDSGILIDIGSVLPVAYK